MNSTLLRIIRVTVAGAVSSLIGALIPILSTMNIHLNGVTIPLAVIIPAALLNGFSKWLRDKWALDDKKGAIVSNLPI